MAAYSKRHYGKRRWQLRNHRVIVLHFTAGSTYRSAWETFATNAPNRGERPGVCSHFVVAKNGRIHRLVRPGIRCRHAIGLNHRAIGVEMVQEAGPSSRWADRQILHRHRQIRSALRLVGWLKQRFGVRMRDVIGHSMANESRFFKDLEGWRNDHTDWLPRDVFEFRHRLAQAAEEERVSLVHLIREPQGDPRGALVLNHGRGTDEHDLHGLLDELDPERRLLGVTPGAPLTNVPPGGRHWYLVPRVGFPDPKTFADSYRLLTDFADGLLEDRGIAWDRTVIGGFSMGAVMSYAVALGEGRPSPAAIVALSGFVPTVEGWSPELESRRGLPAFVHHGRNDPVIDVSFAREARQLMADGGLEIEYLETDAGHWVPPQLLPPLREFVAQALELTSG